VSGHTVHKHACHINLCRDGLRVERQRMLEQPNRIGISVTRRRFQVSSTASENVVQCIGVLDRPGGFRIHQFDAERIRYPAGDFVLHRKEIPHLAIEPLRPEMRVGHGIDQLGSDADPAAHRLTLPSSALRTPRSRPICLVSMDLFR
jgi:hypothetical protein